MISHDDDRSAIPLVLLFEKLADMRKVAVGQSEVIDVGGVCGAESFLLAVVEAVGMGDRHVQIEKVDGGIGEKRVASHTKPVVVAGVLADIAAFISRGPGTAPEEMFGVEPEVVKWPEQINRQRAVRR